MSGIIVELPGTKTIAKKGEHFEKMLRRFKRAVEKAGIIDELREREHYEPPSVTKKRAHAAAVKRWQRMQVETDPVKIIEAERARKRKEKEDEKRKAEYRARNNLHDDF